LTSLSNPVQRFFCFVGFGIGDCRCVQWL